MGSETHVDITVQAVQWTRDADCDCTSLGAISGLARVKRSSSFDKDGGIMVLINSDTDADYWAPCSLGSWVVRSGTHVRVLNAAMFEFVFGPVARD